MFCFVYFEHTSVQVQLNALYNEQVFNNKHREENEKKEEEKKMKIEEEKEENT